MKNVSKLGVLALTAALAGVASAQTNGPSGLSARVGAFFPRVGDTVFAAGLDYKFRSIAVQEARPGYDSYLGLSADYFGKNSNYNIPIAVTYNIRANQAVFGAGLGPTFYRNGAGDVKTALGGQLSATYEFGQSVEGTRTNPIFIQAKYFFNFDDSNANGLGLYLGVRF